LKILVVDDEEVLQDVLATLVRQAGHQAVVARSGEEGLTYLRQEPFDLVLLDLMLPGMSGIEVLRQIRHEWPDVVVVVVTAYSSIEGAIEAMRQGAFHYIPKPFKNAEVLLTIEKGLDQRRLAAENRSLRERLREHRGLDRLVGRSAAMEQVYELVRLAAPSKSNILLLGESGTGKELVAKAIHELSKRAQGPFVTVNSGSMPSDLLESNLFGHLKGAFTGAIANKKGLFEVAHGGTLFFDEIGNIPLETQAKLLRVVQEREFMRLGDVVTLAVDVRLIAATNADLDVAVRQGNFREDLFYRLNVITITLPPLRDRRDDIVPLAEYFLRRFAQDNDKPLSRFAPEALDRLLAYPWPGNVRELENVIERAVVLSGGDTLTESLLPQQVRRVGATPGEGPSLPAPGVSFREAITAFEKRLILRALRASGGVQKRAAEALQLKPTTLHEMMKRLGIPADGGAG
jgi:DNA-binding NtrC family response regulator